MTDCAAAIVTVQEPAPLQAPLQPLNTQLLPPEGVAVKVTCGPPAKVWLHVEGQLMPAGLLVTVPLPVTLTVRLALPPPATTQLVTRL